MTHGYVACRRAGCARPAHDTATLDGWPVDPGDTGVCPSCIREARARRDALPPVPVGRNVHLPRAAR